MRTVFGDVKKGMCLTYFVSRTMTDGLQNDERLLVLKFCSDGSLIRVVKRFLAEYCPVSQGRSLHGNA